MSKVTLDATGNVGPVYLVTGATGFIGRHLLNHLVAAGKNVRAIRRQNSDVIEDLDVQWLTADIDDFDSLLNAMDGVEVVFHLAGVGSPASPFSDIPLLYATNVVGSYNVLEAARRSDVRRVITASSAAVYGKIDSPAIAEDVVPQPVSPYGMSKSAQEALCELYTREHDLETLCLRLFNVYGPNEDLSERNQKLIPNVYRRLMQNESVLLYGDGSQTRDFVHVRDVVAAFVAAAVIALPLNGTLNVGTGVGTTIRDVVQALATHLGVQAEIEWMPARPNEIQYSVASMRNSERVGVIPTVEFAEGIQGSFSRENVTSNHVK